MKPAPHRHDRRPAQWYVGALAALLALGTAQAQDNAKALNLFQQLLVRPGTATPATPAGGSAAPAAALGQALSGAAMPGKTAPGAQAADLIGLLTQMNAVNAALGEENAGSVGLLPAAILTLQNTTEVILTPLTGDTRQGRPMLPYWLRRVVTAEGRPAAEATAAP